MSVAFTELTSIAEFVTTNLTIYPTPSLTAVANRAYLLVATASYATAGTDLSTVAGGGLGTWNIIGGATAENSGLNRRIAAAWMQSASPGAAAAIDITWTNACTACGYSVYEITGHHAVSPIGQITPLAQNATESLTLTLASATAGSGILSACRINAETTISAEAGWTAGENNSAGSPSGTLRTAYRTDISDLSCGFSWTGSTVGIGLIIEILAAAGGGGGNFAPVAMHHRRQQGMS